MRRYKFHFPNLPVNSIDEALSCCVISMESNYNTWAGVPQNPTLYPNPNPNPTDPYQSTPQNPNPSSYTPGHGQGQGLVFGYSYTNGGASSSVYYQDPNVVQLLGANDPYRLGEVAAVSLNGAGKSTPANVNSNFLYQPLRSGSWGRGQRKIKIQPVWCDVCKLEFNSNIVLDKHKLGKRHTRSLEKLKGGRCDVCKLEFNSNTILERHILGKRHTRSLEKLKGGSVITASTSAPLVASAVSDNPFVGLQKKSDKVNSANGQDAGEKAVELVKNLETKKQKVLEGGAATDEVRICLACNVVCNSDSVFKTHLAGKKHIANITKQEKFAPASASLVPSEASVNPFIGPQEKPDVVNSGNGQDAMKKAAELIENLETKTRKVLEGGAATNEVRKCLVCKVVCNSETVFRLHLAGKKHIANMKKQASGAGVAPAN